MKYSYKGMDFLIDIDYKDLPQDGQRIVSMLDSKAKIIYDAYKLNFLNSAVKPLGRIYDDYISSCHNYPDFISVYFICEETKKGKFDSVAFTKEFYDKKVLEFNIKWANFIIDLIKDRIKFMKRKLEFMESKNDI